MENKGLLKKYNRGFRSCMKQTDVKGWLVLFFLSVFVCWKDVALERTRNRRAMHEFKKHAAANLVNVRVIKWLFDRLIDWLTEWVMSDWLTDWLTDCLTCWLTDWLTHWLSELRVFDWLIDWVTGWLVDWLTDSPTDWLTDWLTDSLTDSVSDEWVTMIDWLNDYLTDWLTGWLTDSDWLTNWLRTDSLTDGLVDWSSDLICECFILLTDRFLVWLTERLHNLLPNIFLQLARSFRFWQQLHGHCEVSRAHSQQRDQNQLRECFQEWRDYTLEIRADKHYVVAIQKKVWWEENIEANRLSPSNSLEQNHITLYAKVLLVVLLDRRRLGQKSGRKWRETETRQSVL